ncbi:MAG: hypothetical protein AB1454_03065 [Candidatus Auribacterota bacterium]
MHKIVVLLVVISVLITGCAGRKDVAESSAPVPVDAPYFSVSGNIYDQNSIKIKVDCVARSSDEKGYYYATKKVITPLAAGGKYVIIDFWIQNPAQYEIRIPENNIVLVGQTHTEYRPLPDIKPSSNKAKHLMRNITDYQNSRYLYGIAVFEELPDFEHEIKLQFKIEINDRVDYHYVIFKRTPQKG